MNTPTERVTAYRALCLGAIIHRGEIEHKLHKLESDDEECFERKELKRSADNLTAWIEHENLAPYQSSFEKKLLEKRPGSWKRQETINAGWRTESLGVLLWSLSYLEEIPPYDVEFKMHPLTKELGLLLDTRCFLQCTLLRSTGQLFHAREIAELWHWRSRTSRQQHKTAKGAGAFRVNGAIHEAAQQAFLGQDIPRPIQGDFPAFGKPYAALSPSEYAKATSIAFERHYVLNWLSGSSTDWDRVPTD